MRNSTSQNKIQIKLVKSPYHRNKKHTLILQALGLKKINQIREYKKSPSILGMLKHIDYLLSTKQS